MDGKLRTLRESNSYQKQAKAIGNIKHIDEALRILCHSISFNPDAFPFVEGFENIQMAKTDPYSRQGVEVLALRLWFKQINDDEIELLGIEPFEES